MHIGRKQGESWIKAEEEQWKESKNCRPKMARRKEDGG